MSSIFSDDIWGRIFKFLALQGDVWLIPLRFINFFRKKPSLYEIIYCSVPRICLYCVQAHNTDMPNNQITTVIQEYFVKTGISQNYRFVWDSKKKEFHKILHRFRAFDYMALLLKSIETGDITFFNWVVNALLPGKKLYDLLNHIQIMGTRFKISFNIPAPQTKYLKNHWVENCEQPITDGPYSRITISIDTARVILMECIVYGRLELVKLFFDENENRMACKSFLDHFVSAMQESWLVIKLDFWFYALLSGKFEICNYFMSLRDMNLQTIIAGIIRQDMINEEEYAGVRRPSLLLHNIIYPLARNFRADAFRWLHKNVLCLSDHKNQPQEQDNIMLFKFNDWVNWHILTVNSIGAEKNTPNIQFYRDILTSLGGCSHKTSHLKGKKRQIMDSSLHVECSCNHCKIESVIDPDFRKKMRG